MLFPEGIKRVLDLVPPRLKAFLALLLYFAQFLPFELHGHTGIGLIALGEVFE